MKACSIVLIIALAPAASFAQEPSSAVQGGAPPASLSTVFVSDDVGVQTKGKLLRLNTQEVVLLIDGQERRFDLARVRRVQKRGDSLKNGAIIGAIFGLVGAGIGSGLQGCDHRVDSPYTSCGAASRVGFTLAGAAIWGAIGTGIDALIPGRTTLYQSPTMKNVALAVQATPASVAVRLRW